MAFTLTPELLQKALTGLGIAAGQLRHFDEETKKALGRFFMRALSSGDANGYVKTALGRLERIERQEAGEGDYEPERRPPARRRVVTVELEDQRSKERRRR